MMPITPWALVLPIVVVAIVAIAAHDMFGRKK